MLALIQIEDEQEQQPLPSKAHVEVIWVHRHRDDLLAMLEQLALPPGALYAWVALKRP